MKNRLLPMLGIAFLTCLALTFGMCFEVMAQEVSLPASTEVSASTPSPGAADAVPVTIPLESAVYSLNYNPYSKKLYAVNAELGVSVINGTSMGQVHPLLTSGSGNCNSTGCAQIENVPSSARTYVAAGPIVGAFDGDNLIGTLPYTRSIEMEWNQFDSKLYGATLYSSRSGSVFDVTIIEGTNVANEVTVPYPEAVRCWGGECSGFYRVGPFVSNSVNGLVYFVIQVSYGGFQWYYIGTASSAGTQTKLFPFDDFEPSSPQTERVNTIVTNAESGRTYVALDTPGVAIYDGLNLTALYTFTTSPRSEFTYVSLSSDPSSPSVYALVKQGNAIGGKTEVIEFSGDSLVSRVSLTPQQFYSIEMVGVHPVSGGLYLFDKHWGRGDLLIMRHGAIISKFTDYSGGTDAFYRIEFSDTADQAVLLIGLGNYPTPQTWYYFENSELQAILPDSDYALKQAHDLEVTDSGVWVSGTCYYNSVCTYGDAVLRFLPFTYFKNHGNWLDGQVTSESGVGVQTTVAYWPADHPESVSNIGTDSQGNFLIAGLSAGSYVLQATEYQTNLVAAQYVTVPPSQTGVKLVLKPPTAEPVIFIPGVGGSVLRLPDPTQNPLWPNLLEPYGDVQNLVLTLLGKSPFSEGVRDIQNRMNAKANRLGLDQNNGVYASDVIRWVAGSSLGPPIDALGNDIYGNLLGDYFPSQGYVPYPLDGLSATVTPGLNCNTGLSPTPTLFVFPYDWRKSVAEAATQLDTYIKCIQQIHPGQKITIVAHSMGGLVARRHILDQGGQAALIHRVITLGTPWLGSPKLLNVAFTGDFDLGTNLVLINKETLASLVSTYPGAFELLPSARYYAQNDVYYEHPFREEGWDFDGDGKSTETYDYANYKEAIDKQFGGANAVTVNEHFHGASGQDLWSNEIGTVEYYNITGSGTGTILQVIARKVCVLGNNVCRPEQYIARKGPFSTLPGFNWFGDGTVPHLSGEGSRIANLSSGVQRFYGFSSVNPLSSEYGHGSMPNAAAVRTCITAILLGGTCNPSNVSTSSAIDTSEAYQILIVGAGSALVSDAQGRQSGMMAGTLRLDNIPGVDYYDTGGNAVQIDTPASEPLTVTFTSGSTSLYVEILKGSGATATAATRYLDVQVPANSVMTLHLPLPAANALLYDTTGDGVAETPVAQAPVVAPNPQAAADNTPPIVALNVESSAAGHYLVATAQDASGVKTIWYTLDGSAYLAYSKPVALAANTTGMAHAFADDIVGNRSAVVDLTWNNDDAPKEHIYLPIIMAKP